MTLSRSDSAHSAVAVFLGLSVIIPFLNHFRIAPSGSFHSEIAAGFFLMAAALASLALLPRTVERVDRTMVVAIFLLGALAAGHWAVGTTGYAFAPVAWLSLLGLFLLAFVWGQLIGCDERLRTLVFLRLAWAIVIAAGANALIQVIQVSGHAQDFAPFVINKSIAGVCRVAGNVNQANHANTLAWMGISATAYLFSQRKVALFPALVMLTIFLVSSALTTSRTAWIFVAAFLVLINLVGRHEETVRRRRVLLTVLLAGGYLAATLVSGKLLGDHCASSGERFFSERETSYNQQRVNFARQAVSIWQQAPIFGAGPGSFRAASFDLPSEASGTKTIDYYAHNILLQVLAEFGVVGASILLGTGLIYAKRLRDRQQKPPAFWLAVSWLILVGLHSMVENAFAYAFFIIPVAVMLGSVVATEAAPVAKVRVRPRLAIGIASVFGIGLAAALVLDYDNLNHLDLTANIALNLGAHESPEATERLSEIREKIWFYSPYADLTLLGLSTPSAANLERLRAITARVNGIFPTPETVYYTILIATLDGHMDVAARMLDKLRTAFPVQSEEYVVKLHKVASQRAEFGPLKELVAPVAAAAR